MSCMHIFVIHYVMYVYSAVYAEYMHMYNWSDIFAGVYRPI